MFQDQRAMRQCLSAGLDHNSIEEVRKIKHLRERVSRSKTSVEEEQIEVVATQTILKMDKRLGKHFSYKRQLVKGQQSDSQHKL